MASKYSSGDIKARITIDVTQFTKGLETVSSEAKNTEQAIKKSLNSTNVGDGLKSSLETLKKEFASLLDESKLLKSIDENLIKLTGSFGKVSKSAGNMSKNTLTEFNKMQREATLLKDKLNTLFKTKVSNTNTMSTAEFDKINATLTKAGEQLSVFKGKTDSLVESANVTDTAFARWSGTIQKAETYISQLKAQMNSMNVGETAPKTINAQSINQIRRNLQALADAGHSFTLSLGEGFQRVDNSLINTNEKVARFVQYLKKTGDANLINSVANQLSTMQGKLDATNEASLKLVNTLKGMGEVTGVSIPLNGQMVELKGSMVATEESTNELIMALRQLDPALIEVFTLALQNMKSQFTNLISDAQLFKETLSTINVKGFNNVKTNELEVSMRNNKRIIDSTVSALRELDNVFRSTGARGTTAIAELDGEFVEFDTALTRSKEGTMTLRETLASLSSTQLESLIGQINQLMVATEGVNNATRLYKENLASINVQSFNNIPTMKTPTINTSSTDAIMKAQQGNIERVLTQINKVTTAYEQMGAKGSLSLETVDGKLIKLSSDMVRSSEGATRLREAFSRLNASQLIGLQRQLQSLSRNTDVLRGKMKLCVDTMGNLRPASSSLQQTGSAMEKVNTSSERTKNALNSQKKSVNALDTAYGILRRTLSLVVVMFGFQLAMELFNVGKEAMDASYKIRTLGKEMGWTAQQSQKFQNQANRLQKIYPKIDMNSTAKSVAEMARVYDLTNDEATKFIETAAVFNSAMVKEGRSTEDASLALKDYLDLGQGWNRRMQEIGATKEQLVATGYWDGETQDINAQIKALDAYLKKRHYYQMAKEIYTLDEAYQALQLRLGMFIGQGLQALTPYIISAVKGFLGLLDAIEGVGNALKGNPIFEAVTMFLGIAVSVGILSKGLTMLKVKLAETAVSFLRVFTLNPHLVAIAIAIATIVTVVYELGKAFGWWKDIPSMIDKITQSLGTLQGQLVAVGTAIAGVAFYFVAKGWVTSSNTIVKAIQKVIDKLGQYIKKNKEASETDLPTGGKGKTPDLPDTEGGIDWKKTKTAMKEDLLNNVRNLANYMTKVAMAMVLLTEAIALMVAPMIALAGVGMVFKGLEPQIRAGIEGLQLIAPVILAFIPPIVLIMYASKYLEGVMTKSNIWSAIKTIGVGLGLIAIAIISLSIPLAGIAGLGVIASHMTVQVHQGIVAINTVSEAIMALVPVIPMFMLAVFLGALSWSSGWVATVYGVLALEAGLTEIAIAITSLAIPLAGIAGLGALPINMEGVKKGAEAIKQVSIALQYLSDAMNSVASIVVADLAMKIANFFGGQGWTDLAGSMKKVEEATDSIQTVAKTLGNLSVPDINQEEIKKLGQVAEATKNIKSALDSISGIMNQGNIGGETRIKFGLDGISVFKVDILTELKAKMGDITNFINAFNSIKVPAFGGNYTDKINRIKQVVEAVKQITNALKGIGDIGTSGGIAGGLSWVIWGDLASKYGILFQNIKSTVTFVRRVSQEIQTDNINGEAINRLKNVISHIPYIVNTMNTVRTALNPVKDDAGVRDKFDIIKNNIIVVVNRVRDLLASVGDTSSINADSISRINNITQGVVNIVNKVKELRTALGGDDEGTDVNIGKKLGNIFLTLQYVQNFINAIMWNFGANGGATGDISTVLSTFSNALSQITGIASKVNALNTTLPEPNNDMQLQQKLYRLLQNIMVIKKFMSLVNWNVSKDGGAKGTGATEGMTKMVTDLSNAISSLAKTCDGAVKTLKGKGEAMGSAISNGFKGKVNDAKSAVSGLQKTIGSMASYACNRADDMSVHFNTTATRIRGVAVQVQNVIDKLNSLPSSKDVNVNVNYHTNGAGFRAGFNLPTFGLGLSGIHNTVSSGFGGVIRGIRGLKGVKTLSAPISGNFVDAFRSVIGGMRYSHYYGTKNNGNVTDTLNSGESNCVDGALATLQLARMFGLDGKLGTTMVNGEGHAFAIIEGKIFDATAMQLLGRTKAPNVRYSASNPTQKDKKKESKKEINIIVDMTDSTFYGDEDFEKKAEKLFNRLALELLDVDKNDGV